ncbi:MAG: TonB-dependent receptor [Bryobacteraceae bacterium]
MTCRAPSRSVLAILTLAALSFGQQATHLSGFVQDSSDAGIPEAVVTVTNEDTGFKRIVKTGSDGGYTVASLQPGTYKIAVRKEGFRSAMRFGLKLDIAIPARLDFTLPVGSLHETITVDSTMPSIQSDDASVGTLVTRDWIEHAPLNGRGLLSLLELAPGTVITPATRGEAGQFTSNGQRANSHYFTVDGVSVNSGVIAGGQPAQSTAGALPGMTAFGSFHNLVPLEALEEFRVQTSTLVPEFGRLPGANVALHTRSGTNDFHGSIFEYLRNERFDANDFFANRYSLPRAKERMQDYGAAVGGPLIRNHTFFFASYEQLRLRQPFTWRSPVPTLEARAGAADWVRPLLQLFPEPNGPALGGGTAEWVGQSNRPSRADVASLRLDQQLGSRFRMFARLNQSPSWNEFGAAQLNRLSLRSRTVTAGGTATFSRWLLTEFRAGHSQTRAFSSWTQTRAEGLPECSVAALGSAFHPVGRCDTFYRFSVGGLGQLVSGTESPIGQQQWNALGTVTATTSSHQIRAGFDWRQLKPTRLRRVTNLDVMADSLEDLVERRNLWIASTELPPIDTLLREWSAFAQDTWRATHRLTLTYGVRWEFTPPVRGLVQPAGPFRPAVVQDLWTHQYRNIAPRVGGAFRLRSNGRTVLRGGYGLYFDSSLGIAADIVNGVPSSMWQVGNPIPESSGPGRTLLFNAFDPNLSLPRVRQWNASIEHGFGDRNVVTFGYVGSSGLQLLRREIGGDENANLVRTALATNNGFSSYYGIQAQYRGAIGATVRTMLAYSWSRSMDSGSLDSGLYWVGSGLSAQRDRARSDFDVRQSANAMVSWEPKRDFGPGLRPFTRNWAIDTIARIRSGFPVNVLSAERAMGVSFANVFRPDRVAGAPLWINDANTPGGRMLNRAAFAQPVGLQQGNLGRNALPGFGMGQIDLALRRNFALRERVGLEFRGEVFNLTNHANLGDPVRFLASPLFGQSASMLNVMLGTGTPGSGLSPMLQVGGPRSVQATVRLRF